MPMRLASYKGTRPGLPGLFNRACRAWLAGSYSHTELVFSDGMCASCSLLDGGARLKAIALDPARWDVIDLPDWAQVDEALSRAVAEAHAELPRHLRPRYSLLLLAAFVVPPLLRWVRRDDEVCSTYVARLLGLPGHKRYDPIELPLYMAGRAGGR